MSLSRSPLASTTFFQDAWSRGQELTVHGWICGLNNGRLLDLKTSAKSLEEAASAYQSAVATVTTSEA